LGNTWATFGAKNYNFYVRTDRIVDYHLDTAFFVRNGLTPVL